MSGSGAANSISYYYYYYSGGIAAWRPGTGSHSNFREFGMSLDFGKFEELLLVREIFYKTKTFRTIYVVHTVHKNFSLDRIILVKIDEEAIRSRFEIFCFKASNFIILRLLFYLKGMEKMI
jgi:hypothetical protein